MAGLQRIFVVSTAATTDDLRRLSRTLRRSRLILTTPTPEGKAVVTGLGGEAQPEMLLAPVRFPPVDRGQQLDTLVRNHALQDRFTDVVAIIDPASVTLLLRVMAPDQLPTAGAVTEVGLPRADRPADLRRGMIAGVVLGVLAVLLQLVLPILALPGLAAVIGVVLLVVPGQRYLAQEALLAALASLAVAILLIASAERFPA